MSIKYESISCPKCGSYILQRVVVDTWLSDVELECAVVGHCIYCRHYYEIEPIGKYQIYSDSVSIAR